MDGFAPREGGELREFVVGETGFRPNVGVFMGLDGLETGSNVVFNFVGFLRKLTSFYQIHVFRVTNP